MNAMNVLPVNVNLVYPEKEKDKDKENEDRHITAVHEAGHCIAGTSVGFLIIRASLQAEGSVLGCVEQGIVRERRLREERPGQFRLGEWRNKRTTIEQHTIFAFGGVAAEWLVYGRVVLCTDLEEVTIRALKKARNHEREAETWAHYMWARTIRILEEHREKVEELAALLLQKGEIDFGTKGVKL